MKTRSILISSILIIGCFYSCDLSQQDLESRVAVQPKKKCPFDSVAAAKLGADEYGMRKYVMAFLKRGESKEITDKESADLQKAHLENIERLASEGKLVLAGPFLDKGDLRGIYIFNVQNIEEAEELTKTDPAIKAGVLTMELKEWYGSAAIMQVNRIHKTLQKKKITE